MTLKVLLSAETGAMERYAGALSEAACKVGLSIDLREDHEPETVDYIVYAPNQKMTNFSPFTRAKAVLSLWAGVEKVVENPTLTIPLTRMVDTGLRQGMVEWVAGHVLRYHLGMDRHINNPDRVWVQEIPPLAQNRDVTILGLGELGSACAEALVGLNFNVSGWSRTQKSIPGVRCFSGDTGLADVLKQTQILVLLLPLTPETENLMNKENLAHLPMGAFILNPGRGPLIDDDALLGALNSGQVAHATLDVFRTEPLPKAHPFWAHPNVTVTPHIASDTRPETAATIIADNILRSENDQPLRFLVDRNAGY